MNSESTTKRVISALLPYRSRDGVFEYYLQKRGASARTLQGKFSLFGGGVEEGETIQDALVRELREELEYVPKYAELLSVYESPHDIVHVYVEKVSSDFEGSVVVHEGEYGMFISSPDIAAHPEVSALVKLAIEQFESMHHT